MNNDLNNKEHQLKKSLENLTFDLDTQEIWDSIEPRLPQERKRKLFVWFFPLLGLLSISAVVAYFVFFQESVSSPNTYSYLTHKRQILTSITTQPIKTSAKENINRNDYRSHDKDALSTVDNLSHPTLSSSVDVSEVLQQEKTINDSNQKKASDNNDFIIDTLDHVYTQKSKDDFSKIISTKRKASRSYINILPLDMMNIFAVTTEKKYIASSPQIQPIQLQKWAQFIIADIGINRYNGNTSLTENSDFGEHILGRERNLPSISTMLAYKIQHHRGIYFNLGLQLDRLTARYTNDEMIIDQELIAGIKNISIDDQGNTTNNTGVLIQTTIIQNDIIWHRTHDILQLNVGAGMELYRKSRFDVSIEGNLGVNIWNRNQGYYLSDNALGFTTFDHREENPYQFNGLSLQGRIRIGYQLHKNKIGISPFYQSALSKSTINSNNYTLKNSHYGIQFFLQIEP